ncbi:uncharacterized protein LOC121837296 [Ixodes scapularis]|uniref:uncharacterized protein LOC121837296 n=1 Tax=Ixodes scapularis TaxID=6945 RepID=UPI001C38786D|nr:uncharacterized protein LOC121837296 [Ixodes scapularis]
MKGVLAILKECEFDLVIKKITDKKKGASAVKSLLKGHKPTSPVRIFINESGSWQRSMSNFLQTCLNALPFGNVLSLMNSEQLIGLQGVCVGFSLAPLLSEIYYELPLSCGFSYVGQTGRCLNDRL